MCVCMTTIRSTEFVYISIVANLQFDSKACCVLTCVLIMYVMFNAVGPITGGELSMDTVIPRLHDEAGSTSARRALVEPARRAAS